MYAMSCVALGYVLLIHSPLQFSQKAWANTDTPLFFFGMAAVLIIHIVVSGKMHSQEKYRKVIWGSIAMTGLSAILLIPNIEMIPNLILSYFGS